MSKERELLKQSIEMIKIVPMMSSIGNVPPEIQELLAQPENKREPLSDLDVFKLYEEAEYIGFLAYRKGIKDAEKAHGIGGGG